MINIKSGLKKVINFNRNNCNNFGCFNNPKQELFKKLKNNLNVRLGQLFDLLKAFFTVRLFHLKTTVSAVCNLEGAQYWPGGEVGILFGCKRI